jgi:hypothetical protein
MAEYHGLLIGLRRIIREYENVLESIRLNIFSDSELVVKQINGDYQVSDEKMIMYHSLITRLLNRFEINPKISHVNRRRNKRADMIAKEAMQRLPKCVSNIRHTIYYPNLLDPVQVEIFGVSTIATNDVLTSLPEQYCMVDAAFLRKVRPDLFLSMVDPSPFTFVGGKCQYPVLGLLKMVDLSCRFLGTNRYEKTRAKIILVVLNFAAPFHVGKANRRLAIDVGRKLGSFNLKQSLPREYQNHPFWASAVRNIYTGYAVVVK